MKKIIIPILLLICVLSIRAQQLNIIGGMVEASFGNQKSNAAIPRFNLLNDVNTTATTNKKIASGLNNYSLLQLPGAMYRDIEKTAIGGKPLTVVLPGNHSRPVTLQLVPNPITTPDFVISTPDGRKSLSPGSINKYYTGTSSGNPGSIAAISFGKNGISGAYAVDGKTYFIEQAPAGMGAGMSVSYADADVKNPLPLNCATDEKEFLAVPTLFKPTQLLRPVQGCKTVRVYIEVTYKLFSGLGGTIENATDYVFNLFNVTSTIYKNDGINLQLSEIFIWNTPDPYTNAATYLDHLSILQNRLLKDKRYGTPIHADIAHSLTTVAYGSNATMGSLINCSNLSVAVCGAMGGFVGSFPTTSYGVAAFAHELGHQLGSPHTHSCLWPGGAIDNCANTEGVCPPGPPPVGGGTIMSYCFYSYGINFLNGLGPLPSALIRSIIDTSSCLQSCNDLVCENTGVRGIVSSLNDSVLQLKWNKTASKYRVGIKPNTTHSWQYFEIADADSLVIHKTSCETYYECSIAAFCDASNQYLVSDVIPVGNANALSAAFLFPGSTQVRNICPGDSASVGVGPNNNSFVYNWYIDGQPQPQWNSAVIRTPKPGKYNAVITAGGCTYYSDSFRVAYNKIAPNFLATINGKTISMENLSRCAKRFLWDFGDGTGSTETAPVHTYNEKHTYNIVLKAWDVNEVADSVTAKLILFDQYTDSLNMFSPVGYAFNCIFTPFACQQAVYIKDSLTTYSPQLGYSDNGNTQSSKQLIQFPKNGTLEIKVFPQTGYRTDNLKFPGASDTGTIMLFAFNAIEQFALKFSTWGGVQFGIDSLKIGSIKPGEAGPLVLNAWNTIGVSFGQQGMQLSVNGQAYGRLDSVITPDRLKYLSYSFGSQVVAGSPAGTYVYGFKGALDKVRFSFKENDFTFSSYPPSQGMDTTVIKKTICAGDSFEGHTTSAQYFKRFSGAGGCDSITATYLAVATALNVTDSITPLRGNAAGKISVMVSGGLPPYRYNWNNGETSAVITATNTGNYQLVVTDSLLCKKEYSYFVYSAPAGEDIFRVLPNPAKTKTPLTLQISMSEAGYYSISVCDIAGRQVKNNTLYIKQGINHIPFSLSYGAGTYFLRLNRGSKKPLIAKAVVL